MIKTGNLVYVCHHDNVPISWYKNSILHITQYIITIIKMLFFVNLLWFEGIKQKMMVKSAGWWDTQEQ